MSNLRLNAERLVTMLDTNSDVITYEGYSRLAGEDSIGRVQWDSLLTIIGTRQMLACRSMKDAINRVKTDIAEEKKEEANG